MNVELLGERELEAMRKAGRAAASTLAYVGSRIAAGVTTLDIDAWVRAHTERLGGVPSQLGYEGFQPRCVRAATRSSVTGSHVPATSFGRATS